jgi:hypothetical protein
MCAASCLGAHILCMCSCAPCLSLKDLLQSMHVYRPACVVSGITSCLIGIRRLCAEFLCDCNARFVQNPLVQVSQKKVGWFCGPYFFR